MRQDDRAPFHRALQRARLSAFAPGEFVGQESFMIAGEIRDLAKAAGIGAGTTVLDLCCGTAGPGRLLTAELGCDYLGVDASASAVALARDRAGDLPCRFATAQIPPLPVGTFDVVLLLETMLAFADKDALVRAVASSLRPGGRFAFTLEEGPPLTTAERAAMPDADTVWLTPLDEMTRYLQRAGLTIASQEDHSRAHCATAQALADAFAADAENIAAQIGHRALHELLAAHRLWIEWLDAGRVRKLALVVELQCERARTRISAVDPREETAMAGVETRDFESPDETRTPDKTQVDVVRMGGTTVARFAFEPGWRWSECIKPVAGTDSCQARHVGAVHTGRLAIRHEDGTEVEIGPGDAYVIEPGHDAWVVGDERFVGFEFEQHAAEEYAKG